MKDYKLIAEKQRELIEYLIECIESGFDYKVQTEAVNEYQSEISKLESEPDIDLAKGAGFELNYCEVCIQMTNHVNGVCQKCKKQSEPTANTKSCENCRDLHNDTSTNCKKCDEDFSNWHPVELSYKDEPTERKTADVEFSHSFKFGDIVVNHFASKDNPHREGIFIRYKRNNRSKTAELTNMKGEFWYCPYDIDSKLQVTGSIFASQSLPEISDEDIEAQALEQAKYESYPIDGDYDMQSFSDFIGAIKWYRNEIKSRS